MKRASIHVLINEEGQHSLWPAFKEVPPGWTIAHKSDTRAACLEFINQNWTDMRPKSLIERMERTGRGQKAELSRRSDGRCILARRRRVAQRMTIERKSSGAPFSKCSMKSWPMLRA